MPLHLLGKKSWNVYNPANIERVRRDEAEAREQEKERERRAQDDEVEERLAILRGEQRQSAQSQIDERQPRTKKRKLPGEDDTDRDIRLAQTATATAAAPRSARTHGHSITDKNGNISLIPESARGAESDLARKKQRVDEDPATVYLSHAPGKQADAHRPWYSQPSTLGSDHSSDRAKWGDGKPGREQREAARMSAADPLAMIKRGVRQLRESEKHRKEWKEQRELDLNEIEHLAREKERRHKRDKHDRRRKSGRSTDKPRHARGLEEDDLDSLEDFSLDQSHPVSKPKDAEPRLRHSGADRGDDGHRRRNRGEDRDDDDDDDDDDDNGHYKHRHHRHSRPHRHRSRSRSHSTGEADRARRSHGGRLPD